MNSPSTIKSGPQGWLPDILRTAGVPEGASLKVIKEHVDVLAKSSAPVARSGWIWMIVVEALCVAVPLLWLVGRSWGIAPSGSALFTFLVVLLFVGALWWMRWRGMQRTWARSRLVAEVMRSQMAASLLPPPLERRALHLVPAIRSLLELRDPGQQREWPAWKEAWMAQRLDDQLAFYRSAKERAEKSRKQFTRWSTLLMDVMLAFAASGLVIAMSDRAPRWLRMFGGSKVEIFFGVAGTLLPLGIVLLQSLRHLQQLNRRTGCYERQATMLEDARRRLLEAQTPESALKIVEQTEDHLLSEVVEWYFEAETAEQFFQVRERKQEGIAVAASKSWWWRPAGLVWMVGGVGLLYLLRVILGRAPWVVAACALTLGLLSYTSPKDPDSRSKLRPLGALMTEKGDSWEPDAARAPYGCIIIAHGLHDGAIFSALGEENLWMRRMHGALRAKLGDRCPNIGLVDWGAAAAPISFHGLRLGHQHVDFVGDVAAIKPEAREVGDYLAFRLAQLILEKRIDPEQPLYFIGHSAGGFVVSRAAIVLKKMNLAPRTMHVTILDTPSSDAELTVDLPKVCPVDYYISSGFVLDLDPASPPPGVHVKKIPDGMKLGPFDAPSVNLKAHSFSHEWYTDTVPDGKPGDEGFGRSPFAMPRTDP